MENANNRICGKCLRDTGDVYGAIPVVCGRQLCDECLGLYIVRKSRFDVYFMQPERSKREESQECGMRCSKHCGNTVREVQ
jgi:hypothetical protein